MNVETKKAAASTAAIGNIEQRESYRIPSVRASENLKEFLGVLLLRLAAGQVEQDGWLFFERMLWQYYAVNQTGGAI